MPSPWRRTAGVDTIRIDADILDWLKEALRSSFDDKVQFHATAFARLRERYDRLQTRLDAMYVDSWRQDHRDLLRGKVNEWRADQDMIKAAVRHP